MSIKYDRVNFAFSCMMIMTFAFNLSFDLVFPCDSLERNLMNFNIEIEKSSVGVSSSSSISATSSTSNKYQQKDDTVKPSKSSSSMTSAKKASLTNSISLHPDVHNHVPMANVTNIQGKLHSFVFHLKALCFSSIRTSYSSSDIIVDK